MSGLDAVTTRLAVVVLLFGLSECKLMSSVFVESPGWLDLICWDSGNTSAPTAQVFGHGLEFWVKQQQPHVSVPQLLGAVPAGEPCRIRTPCVDTQAPRAKVYDVWEKHEPEEVTQGVAPPCELAIWRHQPLACLDEDHNPTDFCVVDVGLVFRDVTVTILDHPFTDLSTLFARVTYRDPLDPENVTDLTSRPLLNLIHEDGRPSLLRLRLRRCLLSESERNEVLVTLFQDESLSFQHDPHLSRSYRIVFFNPDHPFFAFDEWNGLNAFQEHYYQSVWPRPYHDDVHAFFRRHKISTSEFGPDHCMLGIDDAMLLHALARAVDGPIFEQGPFVGCSTVFLAQGARDSCKPHKHLFTQDLFPAVVRPGGPAHNRLVPFTKRPSGGLLHRDERRFSNEYHAQIHEAESKFLPKSILEQEGGQLHVLMANLEAQDLMRGTVIMAGDTLPPYVKFRMVFSDATHDKVEFLGVIDGLTSLVHDEGTVMCFHDVSRITKFVPVAWADAELRKRLRVVAGPLCGVITSCFEVFPLTR